jgi:sugar lactone lactonase YvrE
MRFSFIALTMALAAGSAALAFAQDEVPQSGPAKNGEPAWFIYKAPPPSAPAQAPGAGPGARTQAGGRGGPRFTIPEVCNADLAKLCSGKSGAEGLRCLYGHVGEVTHECRMAYSGPRFRQTTDAIQMPICDHSPICTYNTGAGVGNFTNPDGIRDGMGGYIRVEWKTNNMGFKPTYPIQLPEGMRGGAVSLAIDHHDNLWVLERNQRGQPQLFKFSPDHKLLLSIGESVIGHLELAHGLNVDANDNVWLCDEYGSTVQEVSPDGKLLKTLGTFGHRGDWIEGIGQRLIWQPVAVTFAPNGDMYIGEGHANESPNDFDGPDPASQSGAARVIHLDKNGNFLNQWYGDYEGPGKFYQVHDIAVDPRNGDVWVGDREQYRLVVFTANGQFIKTIQMRNLTCNIAFDSKGELWIGTGGDGQYLHINRDGKILGVIGNGPGRGEGQEGETGYIRWDSHGNMWTGDTTNARITEWVKPG